MPGTDTRTRLATALRSNTARDEVVNYLLFGLGTTGDTYYVDSVNGDDNNGGKSSSNALATIDAAINKCTANNGDVILVMPNHAETLSAAAAIDFDVAGVTAIGIGKGTDRPQITFDNTAADIDIGAANVTIRNFHFINDVDGLVAPIDVNAAHFTLENCLLQDATAAKQTLDWIVPDANADYMAIINCEHDGSDTAGAQSVVQIPAAEHVKVVGLKSQGDLAVGNIEFSGAAVDALVEGCRLENANAVDVCIEGHATATGWLAHNLCRIATDGQLTGINTVGTLSLFENYQVNDDGETGVLIGTASA